MAFYYVRDDNGSNVGTATGDGGRTTSQRTGAWSSTTSEYYQNTNGALGATTPPVAGDIIFVANDSAHNYSVTTLFTIPEGVRIISVSTSNQDTYAVGAKEVLAGATNTDFQFAGFGAVYGMEYDLTGRRDAVPQSACGVSFYNCTFKLDPVDAVGGGNQSPMLYDSCTFARTSGGWGDLIIADGTAGNIYRRCALTSTGAAAGMHVANFTLDGGTTVVTYEEMDLSHETSASGFISSGCITQTDMELVWLHYKGCKLASGYSVIGGIPGSPGFNILLTNCGATSAEQEYQYYYANFYGTTQYSTASYRNQSVNWPLGGIKTGLITDTTTFAKANRARPHSFDFPTTYAALSNAASDKLTIYLSCNSTLTNADVWIDVSYPDGTNRHVYNRATTKPAITAAGSTLTTDGTSTWTSGGSNLYKIEIDTSGDPGADCVPVIRANVAKQTTIYWDWYVGLS